MDILPLTPSNTALASTVMAKAFFDEPFALYCLPDEVERAHLLPLHFATLIRFYQGLNATYQTPALEGTCVWEPPCDEPSSEVVIPPELALELSTLLGESIWGRYLNIIRHMEVLRQHEVPTPHWYLALLAVDPACQRNGIGSALLQPILQRADAEKTPAYLWTDQPSSVPFYQRHGFAVVTTMIETDSNVRFWTLRRDP